MFIIILLIIGLGLISGAAWYRTKKQPVEANPVLEAIDIPPLTEQEAVQQEPLNVARIQSQTDISSWKPYQNRFYGFSLKFPKNWSVPVIEKPTAGANWEQKFNFRINPADESNPFEGFDVKIYGVKKVKELANTDESPKLKNENLKTDSQCATLEGHLLETGNYPAEEIYVPISDPCYNAALFFTNTRDAYIYVITPKIKEGTEFTNDPAQEIASHMPEFFSVASTWELIDIQRPKPVPPKPRITAPLPFIYKVDNLGRKVCGNKNDKPSKSKKNKGRHLDMECCLDPDENPNPHCYYDPKKYGKYL